MAVTVDVVLATVRQGQLTVLLVRRGTEPFAGAWALPGGFIEPHEDAQAAAARELAEETGLDLAAVRLEQLRTYSHPGRDPRMRVVSVAHVAVAADLPPPEAGSDAAEARFWPVADLDLDGGGRGEPLAFDHAGIVSDGVERIRAKLEYTTLATALVGDPFTLTDLRRTYEAVWGVPVDPGNFTRKVTGTRGFVTPAGRQPSRAGAAGGRRARLYRPGPARALHPPLLRPNPVPA